MRIFLTGATGLLGNNILRLGLAQGHTFQCLVRSEKRPSSLEGLDCDCVTGDLSSRDLLSTCIGECDAVIHSAAHIHIGKKFRDEAFQINQTGTQNIVDAALKASTRMVHVSTVNTLAVGPGRTVRNEDSERKGQVPSTYVLSKQASEKVVVDSVSQNDLNASIVHPGFMLGPWDWKPSSGRMIQAIAKGCPPLAPSGGNSVCDVRDVATAVLRSLDRGRKGRHYILAGENLTFFEMWTRFAKAIGKRGPLSTLRKPGQIVVGAIGDFASRFMQNEVDINSAAIAMGSQFHWYSSQRAKDELGYQTRNVEDSIRDSVSWLRKHEMLTQ